MSAFSPEFAKVFKVASFSNLISSFPLVIIRIGIIIILGLLSVSSIKSTVFYFWASLFTLSLMFEAFYLFNVSEYESKVKISAKTDNPARNFTIPSAKIILQAQDWDHVSSLLRPLSGNKKIKLFFEKAGFNKEEVEALIKASAKDLLDIQK